MGLHIGAYIEKYPPVRWQHKQDRFTTCFKTCGKGSLFRVVEWGFVLAGKNIHFANVQNKHILGESHREVFGRFLGEISLTKNFQMISGGGGGELGRFSTLVSRPVFHRLKHNVQVKACLLKRARENGIFT